MTLFYGPALRLRTGIQAKLVQVVAHQFHDSVGTGDSAPLLAFDAEPVRAPLTLALCRTPLCQRPLFRLTRRPRSPPESEIVGKPLGHARFAVDSRR